MTIKSGPAKFMKLARRLISTPNIRPFLRVARNFSEADELPAEDRLRLTGRALWESIPRMRPIWKGSISFGLVYIPVAVYPATREEKLSFRQLRSSDLSPIRYKKVAEADSKEVPADQIVKGFEFERGRYVVIKDEDFEKVRIESTHSIDITDFVDLEQVDPKFFYKPYFLEPQKGGEKAYAVLHKALSGTGKIGIAKVVISNREHLAAVKPDGLFLILELMHFASEILSADVLQNGSSTAVSDKELKMAQALIESMAVAWEPEKYRDEYRTALMEIIEQKAQHKEITAKAPAAPTPTNVVDLVKVLQDSLNRTQAVKQKRSSTRDGARRSTSTLVKQRRRAGALG
jgi:DNA end-binding protein Ku